MSGIPTWQAGTTYAPGALVVPSSSPAVAQVQPANAGFEAGTLSGWTTGDPSHWTISTVGPYQGTYCARITGAALTSMQSTTKPAIRVGDTISVSVMARITNAGTDDAHFQAVLQWLDGSGNLLPGAGGYVPGNEVQGVGGFWAASTASGVAPVGAAAFNISLSANPGTHGSVIDVDSASYTYATAAPSAGLVYKATQAAPGKSGASEPVWPAAGSSVTDNQVTWQGEYATRLIWQASPILQSGATEPVWPTQVGAVIHDGTIDWTARSAQITDPNCPQSKIVAIGAGKVFAADNDIVRYCATVNPLDWSSANDAGYLPTGLQTYGSNPVAAMGLYRSNLVVYNAEGFQMWQLDPDPANIALLDALPVASTHNRALAPTANDLFFLSSQGVRSMGIASAGVNLEAGDVGMPVDALVKPALTTAIANGMEPIGTYIPAMGQFWLAFGEYPMSPLVLLGALPTAVVGLPYAYDFTVAGGNHVYSNPRVTVGTLPAWATLTLAGNKLHIAGTPTGGSATVSLTLAVDSGDGQTATSAQSLRVYLAIVWNVADVSSLASISNGGQDLFSNNASAIPGARSTGSKTTGKAYLEIEKLIGTSPNGSVAGFATAAATLGQYCGSDAFGWGLQFDAPAGGYKYHAGVGVAITALAGLVCAAGQRAMLAIDYDAGLMWFGIKGTWDGNPSAGTGATYTFTPNTALFVLGGTQLSQTIRIHAGQDALTYPPPAGFPAGFLS